MVSLQGILGEFSVPEPVLSQVRILEESAMGPNHRLKETYEGIVFFVSISVVKSEGYRRIIEEGIAAPRDQPIRAITSSINRERISAGFE